MNDEQATDGKLGGWDCCVSIIGCKSQGYDLSCVAYTHTVGDVDQSAPHDIVMKVADITGSFATIKGAQTFAVTHGFIPDTKFGEMS